MIVRVGAGEQVGAAALEYFIVDENVVFGAIWGVRDEARR